jgi:glucose-6-phosphate 1-dehydrogenase
VHFRKIPAIYSIEPPPPNYFRFRLNPEVTIALGAIVRSSGPHMRIEPVELLVTHEPSPEEADPYELLLGDAMRGDAGRFAREDYVLEAWRIVEPILNSESPVYQYEPGTWGPPEANSILGGNQWLNPTAHEAAPDWAHA